jgi:hypothetical protein
MSSEDTARQVAALREELRELVASGRIQVDDAGARSITRAEILRGLIAAVNKTGGEHSTVKLARGMRGETGIEVSVRTGDTPGIETAADACAEAVRLYDSLRELYPMTAGPSRD